MNTKKIPSCPSPRVSLHVTDLLSQTTTLTSCFDREEGSVMGVGVGCRYWWYRFVHGRARICEILVSRSQTNKIRIFVVNS